MIIMSKKDLSTKLAYLTSLGFECIYTDSNVIHPNAPGVIFDFSAVDKIDITSVAIKITMKKAFEFGTNLERAKCFKK